MYEKLSRSVQGLVVIITGASSGMGKATAEVFADAGATVIATDIDKKGLENVVKEISKNLGVCEGHVLDVTKSNNINSVINRIIKRHKNIDILINNAGVAFPTSFEDLEYESKWNRTIDVLLTGQMKVIKATLPYILKSSCPRIVNISSTEGFGATPLHSPYTSAKHGVIGLTRSLAVELGPKGVTVNCICPGPINTNMTAGIEGDKKKKYARRRVPLNRYGEPQEVAHATLNLCLPSSSFINGAILPVDGGLSIKRA
tara:strand:- start:1917 stop:2690 length:774 start_codon:yes stop_codon:yes gene_type:complete